jgi:Tol biopolymer transport system component
MRLNLLSVLVLGVALASGCGSADETAGGPPDATPPDKSAGFTGESLFSNPGGDAVAFLLPGSNTILEVNLDGTDLSPHSTASQPSKVWPEQDLILSRTCANESGSLERTFVIVSPDGLTTGSPYSDWDPEWSPDGSTVAVSCVEDDSANVIIVDEEISRGTREHWIRNGRGTLSDLVDIYLISADGSHLRNLTDPAITGLSGDWLPRWSDDGRFVVFESNREGNSDIYVAEIQSPVAVRITTDSADDQTPAWSRDNNYIVFSSNRSGSFEMYAVAQVGGDPFPVGHPGRPVPWAG